MCSTIFYPVFSEKIKKIFFGIKPYWRRIIYPFQNKDPARGISRRMRDRFCFQIMRVLCSVCQSIKRVGIDLKVLSQRFKLGVLIRLMFHIGISGEYRPESSNIFKRFGVRSAAYSDRIRGLSGLLPVHFQNLGNKHAVLRDIK